MAADDLRRKQTLAFIHVTSECNLRCPYCWSVRYGKDIKREHMTQQTAIDAFKWIQENCAEECEVHLFGGEPLMNWPLVKFILENYAATSIALTTNAVLLTDEIIDTFWKYRDTLSVVLSIDGTPEENARSRGKPYDPVMATRLFKHPGVCARMVCTDPSAVYENAKYIVETLGCRRLRVNYQRHMANSMDYYKTLAESFAKIQADPWLKKACLLPGSHLGCKACRAGTAEKLEISIVTNGDMYPCDMGWWCGWGYVGNIYTGIDWDLWDKWVKEKEAMYASQGIISMCAVEQYMSKAISENNMRGELAHMMST